MANFFKQQYLRYSSLPLDCLFFCGHHVSRLLYVFLLTLLFSCKNPGQTFHAYTQLMILPGSSKGCLTWFRYRVSIHHPLRFNWHPDWKVLVYNYYSLRIQLCPKISGFPGSNPILFGWDVSTINPIRSGGVWILTVDG